MKRKILCFNSKSTYYVIFYRAQLISLLENGHFREDRPHMSTPYWKMHHVRLLHLEVEKIFGSG